MYEIKTVRTIGEHLYLKDGLAKVYFALKSDDDSIEHIPAHKCQLAAASDVYKALFNCKLIETDYVKLTEITFSAFKEFLTVSAFNCFTSVELNLQWKIFAMVKKFGHLYNVAEYLKVGLNFLEDILTDECVCSVYELSLHFDIKEFKQFCGKRIATILSLYFEKKYQIMY